MKVKLELDVPDYLSVITALRIRAIEARAQGHPESRFIRAFTACENALKDALAEEFIGEPIQSMPFHSTRIS